MGHPLVPNLTKLSNEELNNKYSELTKRLNTAHRMGNTAMVYQLQLLAQDYQFEIDNRNRKALEELEKNSKTFKNIIDIQ